MVELDEIDKIIISTLEDNPYANQKILSDEVNLTQPAIGARIKKLKKEGLIDLRYGVDVNKLNMILAKVEAIIEKPEELEKSIKNCPCFMYSFRQTGQFNFCALFGGISLKDVFNTINFHFNGKRVNLQIITNMTEGFFPLKLTKKCQCLGREGK